MIRQHRVEVLEEMVLEFELLGYRLDDQVGFFEALQESSIL